MLLISPNIGRSPSPGAGIAALGADVREVQEDVAAEEVPGVQDVGVDDDDDEGDEADEAGGGAGERRRRRGEGGLHGAGGLGRSAHEDRKNE